MPNQRIDVKINDEPAYLNLITDSVGEALRLEVIFPNQNPERYKNGEAVAGIVKLDQFDPEDAPCAFVLEHGCCEDCKKCKCPHQLKSGGCAFDTPTDDDDDGEQDEES